MSTFAPLQFLKSAQNPLVWTAIDNGTDTRTNLIIYYGAVNTLPADTEMYEVNCIMMHQAEKQLYANTGTSSTPSWEAFGPNSAFPQPLVPGSFLFTDGATVYWATQLVGQIQYNASNLNTYGILNFNSLLVASNDVPNSRINVDLDVVTLAGDATFISNLEGNLDLANIGGAIDLSTQVTGVLSSTNIDITNLESNLDLANIAGSIDLTTQVTGQLPASNIDITDLESNLTLGNIGGSIDLTTQVTGQLPATNIDIAGLITAINLTGDIEVVTDGVTITGNGTTASPLVATGGSSSDKKVGVGEIASADAFNSQLVFSTELWTTGGTNRYTNIDFGAGNDAITIAGIFPGIASGSSAANFADARVFTIQALVYLNANVGGFGFNQAGSGTNLETSTNTEGVYFVSDGANLYAQVATGAARTQLNLGSSYNSARARLRIEFDRVNATPQARFYVNGTLVATLTTNLPATSIIGAVYNNATGGTFIESSEAPSVSMTF